MKIFRVLHDFDTAPPPIINVKSLMLENDFQSLCGGWQCGTRDFLAHDLSI